MRIALLLPHCSRIRKEKWWFKTKRCRWRWTDEMIKWSWCATQPDQVCVCSRKIFMWKNGSARDFFPINMCVCTFVVWLMYLVQINMENIDVTKWWHELESLLHWRFVCTIKASSPVTHHQYMLVLLYHRNVSNLMRNAFPCFFPCDLRNGVCVCP